MAPVRILIADDHELVRRGLRALLAARPTWEVCGEAADGHEAIEKAALLKPDVVLLDLGMPRLGGLEAAAAIRRRSPASQIVIVSQHEAREMLPNALAAGACGFVSKSDLAYNLLTTLDVLLTALPASAASNDAALTDAAGPPVAAAHAAVPAAIATTDELPPAALHALAGHLLRRQDEEHRRIARDLHDGAGQTLAALSIELAGLAERALDAASQLAPDIERMQQLVQQATRELRAVSHLLHPPLLEETGLGGAARWHVANVAQLGGVDISLEMAEDFPRLPGELEAAAFDIVREALRNVLQHSGAGSASVRISCSPEVLSIEVSDAGRGIAAGRLQRVPPPGFGIPAMRERVHRLRGTLSIVSGSDGTQLRVALPLPAPTPGASAG